MCVVVCVSLSLGVCVCVDGWVLPATLRVEVD